MKEEKKEESEDQELEHWFCEKCKIRIGVIDTLEKQIRIRYKDLVVLYEWDKSLDIQSSDRFKVICRRCAWINTKQRNELLYKSKTQK